MEVIRVLVVEDTDEKYDDIRNKFVGPDCVLADYKMLLERAKSYTEAAILIEKQYFDVVILDLMLPLVNGGTDHKFEYAKSLYDSVVGKQGAGPFLIVGLSAFAPEKYSEYFSENEIFSIEDYQSDNWIANIAGRIRFISRGKAGLRQFLNNNFEMDAILLTARKRNEFDPICAALNWLPGTIASNPRISDFKNKFGIVKLSNGKEVKLGVICIGVMGLSISAGVTARVIQQFRPKFLAMVGMCCGFQSQTETNLGDVVIARQTANWDEGKYDSKKKRDDPEDLFFHNRAIEKSPSSSFVRRIEQVLEDKQSEIEKKIGIYLKDRDLSKLSAEVKQKISGECKVHFGQMVSGASVVDNLQIVEKILARFPQAIALEMEAHSIYSASEVMDGVIPDTIVVKGVADHGDGKKKSAFQPIASVAAAMVAMEILEATIFNED